jgi:hypothetical protein
METPAVGAYSGSLPNANPQPAPAFSTLQRGGNASVRELILAPHNITADPTMLLTPRALSRKS